MDRLYSKSALIIKAAFCTFLAPLYMLLSSLISIEDGFAYILITVVPVGCLFTIPFWLSVFNLIKYRSDKIFKYILFDAAVCLAPAILGTVFSEIVYTVANGASIADGFVTIILSLIFFVISFVFWLAYFILYKIK